MRTLKKISLDGLKAKMPVVSEMELRTFVGGGWGEDLLGAIYNVGYSGTINLTDFVKPVDSGPNGYYPISASGVSLSIGNTTLNGINIQGATSNNFKYFGAGYGWTRDVMISGNILERRNYIFDVGGTDQDLWISVPADQVANFERLFKDFNGR